MTTTEPTAVEPNGAETEAPVEPTEVSAEPTEATDGTRVTGEASGELEAAHYLSVLDGTGDTKLIWDIENEDEIAAARTLFAELKGKGFLTYKVGKNGEQSEVIHEFDPQAAAIIASPQPVGG